MANANIGTTRSFTPSDLVTDNSKFNMVLVTGTAGNVVVVQEGGNVVTINSVPSGVWIPVGNAVRINSTNTTAAGFLVV